MAEALRRTAVLRFLSILSVVAAAPALIAQVQVLTLRDMSKAAGTIFIGTVTQAQGGTDEHGEIVTYTTFKVEKGVHGALQQGITIKQLGGETPGLSMRLEHMRYFRTGERVLVMLYPVSYLGFTSPVGLNQGVWSVADDGSILGVSDEALSGLDPILRANGITAQQTQSISQSKFIAIINTLLKEGGKR